MSEKTTDTDCCVSLVKRKRESSKLRKSLCRSQKRSKSLLELQKKLKLQEEKYAEKLKKAAEKKMHRRQMQIKWNSQWYKKNRTKKISNTKQSRVKKKHEDNPFHDFGKKRYSVPISLQCEHKSSKSSSKSSFQQIDESCSYEDISNCLIQHTVNRSGSDHIEKLTEDINKRFNLRNFIGGDPDQPWQTDICVICDELIIGLEPVKTLTKDQILDNKGRISVESFQSHYVVELREELIGQYQVQDEDLHGLLLSPRGVREHPQGVYSYICCRSCYNSMISSSKEDKQNPPKFAIANGFVIGHVPRTNLTYHDSNGQPHNLEHVFDPDKHLNDLICAAISPVRPYGYVHAYQGGSQKSITGHFSFFSVDQSHVGGVLNKYKSVGSSERKPSKNIFVVLCGRMTPNQKRIVKEQAELDTDIFLHLLNWFIIRSGHSGFEDVDPPEDCSELIAFLRDDDTENNTDESVDNALECRLEGKTYYFSDESHNPSKNTSVFDATKQFVKSMLENSTPTMLMYGGSYLKSHEVHLEDVFPIQFPFGLGGPNPGVKRKVPVSEEACLRHYMRLSLKQFMKPDFILVCYHLLTRCASYTTGLIKCKSDYKGSPLADKISQLTVADIERAAGDMAARQANNEQIETNTCASSFLKSVSASCKVAGHTTEAAKDARRKVYAMTDRLSAHSIMFTVTPCDENTFKVRMYASEGAENKLPSLDCSEAKCFFDFGLRCKARTDYPGACSLFYQSAIQAVYELLGWDPIKNCPKEEGGIFGHCKAIVRADEEQNRKTLHAHILVWLENFAKMYDMLFHEDEDIRQAAKKGLTQFVEKFFTSDYGYDNSLQVTCEKCGHNGSISELFSEADLQDLRDCRNKHLSVEFQGKILVCNHCGNRISTPQLNDMIVDCYRRECSLTDDAILPSPQVQFPLSKARRDIMTYRFPLDNLTSNSTDFFKNERMRHHVANRRVNEHDYNHRTSCFKYSDECRAHFPEMSVSECKFFEDNEDDSKCTTWRNFGVEDREVYPFSIKSKRSIGSQYLNTFNDAAFRILGCNNNVQMGSARCIFYVVHYATKSTQKEDRGVDFEKIGAQVMRRIRKEELRLSAEEKEALKSGENADYNYNFREGLSRFLLGMNVHLSQDVVSATMAHLLICQRGSRFTFSHDFIDLLVGQMLNYLKGQDPGYFVLKRKNRHNQNEAPVLWPDYSVNDYIFRPRCLDNICFYEFGIKYEKGYFTFAEMKVIDEYGLPKLKDSQGAHF